VRSRLVVRNPRVLLSGFALKEMHRGTKPLRYTPLRECLNPA
jgi:hypothetical protein